MEARTLAPINHDNKQSKVSEKVVWFGAATEVVEKCPSLSWRILLFHDALCIAPFH